MMILNKKRKSEGVQKGEEEEGRVTVVLGEAWGDEGKGKLVDDLAQRADII